MFSCKKCRTVICHQDLSFYLRGFAGDTTFQCVNCCEPKKICRAETIKKENVEPQKERESNHTMLPSSKYSSNIKLVLCCQRLGVSAAGATEIAGHLGVNHFGLRDFSETEEQILLAELQLAKEIICENLEVEKSLSPFDDKLEKWLLTVSIDAGWHKRSTGKIYNSKSGQVIMVGKRSGLVIGLRYCSTECSKCHKGLDHLTHLCPKNHTGSLGSMESLGAVQLAMDLLKLNCLLQVVILDDDASTWDALTPSKWRKKKRGVRE